MVEEDPFTAEVFDIAYVTLLLSPCPIFNKLLFYIYFMEIVISRFRFQPVGMIMFWLETCSVDQYSFFLVYCLS